MTARRAALALDDRPAGLGRRFVGGAIDVVVALAAGGGLLAYALAASLTDGASMVGPAAVAASAVTLLAVLVTQWLAHGRLGWTVGRLVVGVRTVGALDRWPIGPWRVLVRALVVAAASLVPVVGTVLVLCSPLFDRTGRRRGWHDLAAGSEVLRSAPRATPFVAPGSAPLAAGPGEPPRPLPLPASLPAAGATARAGRLGPPVPLTPAAPLVAPAAAPTPVPAVAQIAPGSWAAQAAATDAVAPAAAPGLPLWAGGAAAVTGSLQLAAIAPPRVGPGVDTRMLPVVLQAPVPAPVIVEPEAGIDLELEETHRAPGRDVPVEAPAPVPRRVTVQLDDGSVVTVDGTALVGRKPAALVPVQLIAVADPRRSVSKTHLQIGVDTHGVWVADRGSTNGTVVRLPDGGEASCPVDRKVRLEPGAVVTFGDRSLRVVPEPAATRSS